MLEIGKIIIYYGLNLCLIISLYFFLKEVLTRLYTKKYFNDLYKIHDFCSITWLRIEENRAPTPLELLIDLAYIKNNLRSRFRNYLFFSLFFMVFFISLSWLPMIYGASYLISLVALTTIIFLSVIFGFNTIISTPTYKLNNTLLSHILISYLLAPIKGSFLTLYILLNFSRINLGNLNGTYVFSIIFLKSPFGYLKLCFQLSNQATECVFDPIGHRKSWKGCIRTLSAKQRDFIMYYHLSSSLVIDQAVANRRIIVEDGKIRLNGGLMILIENSNSLSEPLFMLPYRIRLDRIGHQAFKKNHLSKQYFIFTSSNEIEADGGTYKSVRLDYSGNGQFVSYSYLDLPEKDIEKGFALGTWNNNGLTDYANLIGTLIKLNIYFRFYESKQILFQSEAYKYMHALEKPVPAEISHINLKNIDINLIAEKAESAAANGKRPLDISIDEYVNEALEAKPTDIFYIAKRISNLDNIGGKVINIIKELKDK